MNIQMDTLEKEVADKRADLSRAKEKKRPLCDEDGIPYLYPPAADLPEVSEDWGLTEDQIEAREAAEYDMEPEKIDLEDPTQDKIGIWKANQKRLLKSMSRYTGKFSDESSVPICPRGVRSAGTRDIEYGMGGYKRQLKDDVSGVPVVLKTDFLKTRHKTRARKKLLGKMSPEAAKPDDDDDDDAEPDIKNMSTAQLLERAKTMKSEMRNQRLEKMA